MQSFPLALILTSVPFMISMGITPGPNNILVASSGLNFGFSATLPHILRQLLDGFRRAFAPISTYRATAALVQLLDGGAAGAVDSAGSLGVAAARVLEFAP